jgi:hypothetical protein
MTQRRSRAVLPNGGVVSRPLTASAPAMYHQRYQRRPEGRLCHRLGLLPLRFGTGDRYDHPGEPEVKANKQQGEVFVGNEDGYYTT